MDAIATYQRQLLEQAQYLYYEMPPIPANNVTVFRTGEGWTLVYSAGVVNQHLAWARSPDLLRWEIKGALPLPAQRWMSRKHGAPFEWREADGYVMMLMGTDTADRPTFGLLTSWDGVQWAPLPEQ